MVVQKFLCPVNIELYAFDKKKENWWKKCKETKTPGPYELLSKAQKQSLKQQMY